MLFDLRYALPAFASLLIQQGESLAYVQQQLGHSSIQVTVDVYGDLLPGPQSLSYLTPSNGPQWSDVKQIGDLLVSSPIGVAEGHAADVGLERP